MRWRTFDTPEFLVSIASSSWTSRASHPPPPRERRPSRGPVSPTGGSPLTTLLLMMLLRRRPKAGPPRSSSPVAMLPPPRTTMARTAPPHCSLRATRSCPTPGGTALLPSPRMTARQPPFGAPSTPARTRPPTSLTLVGSIPSSLIRQLRAPSSCLVHNPRYVRSCRIRPRSRTKAHAPPQDVRPPEGPRSPLGG